MIKSKKLLIVCLSVGLSGIVAFYLIPFVAGIVGAFSVLADGGEKTFGIDNFARLFKNSVFQVALKNTFVFTLVTVVLANVLSFALASMIKNLVKNSLVLSAIILPMAVPTIVIAAVFGDTVAANLEKAINMFSAAPVDLVRGEYAFLLIVVIFLWKYTGFHALIYMTALSAVPFEQYEAASIDGAGAMTKMLHITLPCILPFICFNMLLSIMNSFRIFRDIYVLFGDYPPPNVYLVQHFIQNNFIKLNLDYVFCAAYIFFGILTVIFAPLIINGNITENYYDE
ncbi:MAG: sugar ABC transporter permease [Oscillospiraceae bacterium]|nr:sugar ABC transporter permease [Oscillospiraceae bacterium]